MREPTLLPVFGRLGVKLPAVVAATPTRSKSIENVVAGMREMLSSHWRLTLKLFLALWTVSVLAAVFFTMQG